MRAPAEYNNDMIRRQIVLTLTQHADSVFPKLKESIRGIYGSSDYVQQGPYSFQSYLEAMLESDTYGDEGMLLGASIAFNIGITVVWGHCFPIQEHRIRHNKPLAEADLVLIFDGSGHYSAVCKCLFLHSFPILQPRCDARCTANVTRRHPKCREPFQSCAARSVKCSPLSFRVSSVFAQFQHFTCTVPILSCQFILEMRSWPVKS